MTTELNGDTQGQPPILHVDAGRSSTDSRCVQKLDPWFRIERVTARGRETMASATEEELFLTPGAP